MDFMSEVAAIGSSTVGYCHGCACSCSRMETSEGSFEKVHSLKDFLNPESTSGIPLKMVQYLHISVMPILISKTLSKIGGLGVVAVQIKLRAVSLSCKQALL